MGFRDLILQRLARSTKPLYTTMDAVPAGGLSHLFHGTPHVFPPEESAPFGRFRDDKIGSGEGAQAYTHGHYVSGSESLAAEYQRKLTQRGARSLPSSVVQELQTLFPDLRYMTPLGKKEELAATLSGGNIPGKLSPLSHVRQAAEKNFNINRDTSINDLLREFDPSIEETLLTNQRLSPEQRTLMRSIVDPHFGTRDFGGAARLGSTLPPEMQHDVLANTLNPDEFVRIQSYGISGADLSNPRTLNKHIIDSVDATGEFNDRIYGINERLTLYPTNIGNNQRGIFRNGWRGIPGWDESRNFSSTLLDAFGAKRVSNEAASLGRNVLAQTGRYDMRDFIDSQGLGALRDKVGAGSLSGKGALYRVATDNPPSNFWTLDTKIAEHPPELAESILLGLAEAANTQKVPFSMYKASQSTGLDTYQRLLNEAGNRGAMNRTISEKLLAEGVPGVQYLRGGQRGPGVLQQTYDPEKFNFVFFDPEQASIIERRKAAGGPV